jgi:hypothetical protein
LRRASVPGKEKQIPFGNDRKKGNGNNKGKDNSKGNGNNKGKDNSKGKYRGPSTPRYALRSG